MKQLIISLCACLIFVSFVQGQDIIIKNDKSEIKSKIIEIQDDFIRYYLYTQQEGPIRNIRVSDVFMVLYADGTREIFRNDPTPETLKPVINEPPLVFNEEQSSNYVSYQQPEINDNEPAKWGFIFGGKAGYYIPYNQTIAEMYGGGFMGGLIIGYWGKGAGIEIDWRFYSKSGNPYTYGAVDDADASLSISPLTMTVYWDVYHKDNFSTYIGGGLGAYFIHEDLLMSAYGQTASASESLTGFEYHSTGGIRFSPFYVEVTFSSCTVRKVSFGGIIISGGLFF
jgi:hypothetical protein